MQNTFKIRFIVTQSELTLKNTQKHTKKQQQHTKKFRGKCRMCTHVSMTIRKTIAITSREEKKFHLHGIFEQGIAKKSEHTFSTNL